MNEPEHQPTTTTADRPKAGAGPRVLAVIAALGLAFAAAVAVLVMIEVSEWKPCADVVVGECFDGSSLERLLYLVFGWPGAVLLALSVILAFGFAVIGRGGRRLVAVAVAGAVLFGLAVLIGSI